MSDELSGSTPTIRLITGGLVFQDRLLPIPLSERSLVDVLGPPDRIVAGKPPAPAGHRNNDAYIYDSLGLYWLRQHDSDEIISMSAVFGSSNGPISVPFIPASPFCGAIVLPGLTVTSNTRDTELRNALLAGGTRRTAIANIAGACIGQFHISFLASRDTGPSNLASVSISLRRRPRSTAPRQTFRLSVGDNGLIAFHNRIEANRCEECGALLSKWDEKLPGFKVLNLKGLDISCTYDGIDIASALFKECYDSHKMIGLSFSPLAGNRPCFKVVGEIVVPFDAAKRATRFLNQCQVCGRYEEIIGATPVFLKAGSEVPDNGFARTDLEFGTGDRKSPMLLCGATAAVAFTNANLSGVDLVAI